MAKKKIPKRTPEEQAAYNERTRRAWERIAEREAIDRAEEEARSRAKGSR
jgi:hypothetical protein